MPSHSANGAGSRSGQADHRALDERRVRDREADAAIGHGVEQGADAGGHPLRAAARRVLPGQTVDHAVRGQLPSRIPRTIHAAVSAARSAGETNTAS